MIDWQPAVKPHCRTYRFGLAHASLKKSMNPGRILLIDEDAESLERLDACLQRDSLSVTTSKSLHDALDKMADDDVDVVIVSMAMSEMGWFDFCCRAHGVRPDVSVILIAEKGDVDAAAGAIRVGAFDYLVKPIDAEILERSVDRALARRRQTAPIKRLRESDTGASEFTMSDRVIGSSASMRRVFAIVRRVADSDAAVLIHGETGTGKELIARSVHEHSRRQKGPFVAINCASIPANLLESELFGHERGAFTDAKQQRTGLFLQASGGTLFLDEIGELPIEVQPKLLRALQQRSVRPVGSNKEIAFDARVLTATNRVLEDEVYEGRFREDLFYRINVVKIDVPPLRERGGDVLELARYFVAQHAKRHPQGAMELSLAALDKLRAYAWPGNVRELENCIDGAVALARGTRIEVDDLPEKVRSFRPDRFSVAANHPDEIVTIDELERRYILRVLVLVGGNKSRAAQVLGFDRRTLYRKLERYEEKVGTMSQG